MLENNTNICDKCGNSCISKIEENTQGLYCEKCNKWLVVATHIPAIESDPTIFKIFLDAGDFKNKEQIKVLSTAANINFLEARKLLKKSNAEIFSGSATKVKEVSKKLKHVGIDFYIDPVFPY